MGHSRASFLLGPLLLCSDGSGTAPADGVAGLRLSHDPVGCVVAGQYPRLEALVEPTNSAARVRVQFRTEASPAWYSVEMTQLGGRWGGVLPKPSTALRSFRYYIEATGTSFEESRTEEYAPRVVGAQSECGGLPVAALSAVGPRLVGAPAGAPALPAGFTSLAPAVAATAAAAGGGGSTGLVVGVVAGAAAAIGGGVALAAGGSKGDSPGSGSSSSGTTSGGSGGGTVVRAPQSLILALSNDCTLYGGVAIYAGDTVRIARGICAWSTAADARAACAGQTATLSVDGAPIGPVAYSIGYDGANGLVCSSAEADWRAVAGRHVATGIWTLPDAPLHSCPMDVQP